MQEWFQYLRDTINRLNTRYIEIVDSSQTETPPTKKKKIHPLRKLLGDNFGGLVVTL